HDLLPDDAGFRILLPELAVSQGYGDHRQSFEILSFFYIWLIRFRPVCCCASTKTACIVDAVGWTVVAAGDGKGPIDQFLVIKAHLGSSGRSRRCGAKVRFAAFAPDCRGGRRGAQDWAFFAASIEARIPAAATSK